MADRLNASDLDRAIELLCARFEWHANVEILVVGGAAGMMTGLLHRERTTGDCDVINYIPAEAWHRVELIADQVGIELELPVGWFNSHVQIRSDSLPGGWADRRVLVYQGPRLSVYAASRIDLIAMKFLAHRPQDLVDLTELKVTVADEAFVRSSLLAARQSGSHAGEISEAMDVLNSWPTVRQ
jgi:hypothetical protein